MTEAPTILDDFAAVLTANNFQFTRAGADALALVIPVPVHPGNIEADRWSGPTKGTFVVTDNDGLELLFYPDTTWADGGYDDEAAASAATGLETHQLVSAIYDFGKPLNEIMDFDHVIEVKPNGLIVDVDGSQRGNWAPDLRNGELEDSAKADGWSLMDGYSGQDRYSGPVMHNSEFIGGGMERDIRDQPGIYVALVCYWDEDEDGEIEPEDDNVEGWAVARKESQ